MMKAAAILLIMGATFGAVADAQTEYHVVPVRNGGRIRGTVRLMGQPPQLEELAITKDDRICGAAPAPSRLLLGKDMGLQDAVVFLEGIREGKKFPPAKRIVLDQRQCEFSPHVLLLPATAALEVVNSDPVLHNVHAYDLRDPARTLFNIAQPIRGQRSAVTAAQFRNATSVLTTCDAGHPWMVGYIIREEHPYYTLTDRSGSFVLENIPPGTYTLAVWHEGVRVARVEKEKGTATRYTLEAPYLERRPVTVTPGGTAMAEVQLTLRPAPAH